jgi:hypothetical protein
MKNRKMLLPVLFSIALVFSLILTASVLNTAPVMARGQVTRVVGADNTVSVGKYYPLECDVSDWKDIIQVAAGSTQTVGLKSDGTVVAVGYGYSRTEGEKQPYEVGGWTGIIQVAAGGLYTVGLKSDGTVVAVGDNYYGQCDVGGWANITQVAASGGHTVGLRSNGTVMAVGDNDDGQCNVGNWTDIVQVAAGGEHTVGLKADGTVVAVGSNAYGKCDVGNWTGIIQVAAGTYHTVGLKADGTVVAACIWLTTIVPGSGCFIATAAYGTPMAGEIEILRQFRDEYLLTNPLGQALVGLYYRVSPPIAEFIIEYPSLKPIVRAGLAPAVAMSAVAVNTSPAEKIAILGLFVLVSVVMTIWATRRPGRDPEHT